jgi:hypothetical protein
VQVSGENPTSSIRTRSGKRWVNGNDLGIIAKSEQESLDPRQR